MDATVLQTVAERLEVRATDAGYVALSQAYFQRLPTSPPCRLLALGCGTGVEVRALKRMLDPAVSVVGIDHSAALVERAREETEHEGLSRRRVHHRERTTCPGRGELDVVIMHTLISHVDDPGRVLSEARRVLRPGGTIAIFDGDYASLTFAHPDPELAVAVEEGIKQVMVANPRVMRAAAAARRRRPGAPGRAGHGVRRHRHRRILGERGRGVRGGARPLGAAPDGGRGGLAHRPGRRAGAPGLLRRSVYYTYLARRTSGS